MSIRLFMRLLLHPFIKKSFHSKLYCEKYPYHHHSPCTYETTHPRKLILIKNPKKKKDWQEEHHREQQKNTLKKFTTYFQTFIEPICTHLYACLFILMMISSLKMITFVPAALFVPWRYSTIHDQKTHIETWSTLGLFFHSFAHHIIPRISLPLCTQYHFMIITFPLQLCVLRLSRQMCFVHLHNSTNDHHLSGLSNF